MSPDGQSDACGGARLRHARWAVLPIRGGSRVSLSADGVKDTSKEEGRTLWAIRLVRGLSATLGGRSRLFSLSLCCSCGFCFARAAQAKGQCHQHPWFLRGRRSHD